LPFLLTFCLLCSLAGGKDWVVFEGKSGPGKGKHIVLLSGDEEYRSEEGLPQLARILSERHGFKCTVLFAINPATGAIDPTITTNMPGAEALDSADAILMLLRYREWPDGQMKHFVDAYLAGKPIIALRTSTHAFNYGPNSTSQYAKYGVASKEWSGGFGRHVLGETWVAHHGAHKKEATRGIIEPSQKDNPILRAVTDVFCTTDVYAANPPEDVTVLMRGQVLSGMEPSNPPVEGPKNAPMQPIVWTRFHKNEAGTTNKILCTTMGAATDLQNEGLRRMIVNGVYWGLGMKAPAKADVNLVGEYKPSMYGFNGFVKGVKPDEIQVGKPRNHAAHTHFELKAGDHIALVGNALPDRFQHSGWLESMLYAKYPQHDLVFRNLAVAGDEVGIRHRPENFGSTDDWLKKTQTDVVFAFFGFNESFKGDPGLAKFRSDLDTFLKGTLGNNYSGKGNPRVVLFSPIAEELHPDRNFPPPTNDTNLALYSSAMQEVARQNGVQFIDLFNPSLELYRTAAKSGPLTIDGMHLSEKGDELLAKVIMRGLFGGESVEIKSPPRDVPELAKLRAAINEKNAQWHARYRTIDGYNVYGGRSALAYQPGKGGFITDRNAAEPYVSNYKVMQEEMAQRDALTENGDKQIWAIAKGTAASVEIANLPPVEKIKSNHPGPNPDETFPFLGGEEAIHKMKAHPGTKVNLFASEERFPELVKPVQMAWDTKGRLWVAVWPNYPERSPESKHGDSLIVLEDTDGDGKADKCTHFADDLNGPTGFQFYKDGVLLVQAPDVWFMRDLNHDGRADWKKRVLMGLSSADSHHTANSLCLDPQGAVYLSDGVFHRTQVETATGPVRNDDAGIFRYEPRTGKFERYVAYHFANPHGRVFDYWGNDLITDATGNNTYFGPAFSGQIDYPGKHAGMKEFWDRPSRPCSGTGLLTSRHFPEEFQGNFLDCNVISFQGIYRVKVSEEGSGLRGQTVESLISSSDANFRPTAVNVGPDGAVYFADWQNPIIGHMQHHLRDPNRDHEHGRIYRITYEGRPLNKRPKIDGQPIPALLKLLKEPENQVREWAKVELGKRPSQEVVSAARKWAAGLDKKEAGYTHHLLEALWVQAWHNTLDDALLRKLLQAPEPQARAAAGRVLCYLRDRLPDVLDLYRTLAKDEHPRVRLEAVRAASFFRTAEAADIVFSALSKPTDYYLNYTAHETLRQLEPLWKKEIESSSPLAQRWSEPGYTAARDFMFVKLGAQEILALPHTPLVLETIIGRNDISEADRVGALVTLAQAKNTSSTSLLIARLNEALEREPKGKENSTAAALAALLPYQRAEALAEVRSKLMQFAQSQNGELSTCCWAGIITADGDVSNGWHKASASPAHLANLLNGIPRITSPDLRTKAYPLVEPLVSHQDSADGKVFRAAVTALCSMPDQQQNAFSALTKLIVAQKEVAYCARSLRSIPQQKWEHESGERAAEAILQWCKSVPGDKRT